VVRETSFRAITVLGNQAVDGRHIPDCWTLRRERGDRDSDSRPF
jgi:hypothetical protein